MSHDEEATSGVGIIGIGAQTALGRQAFASAAAVRAGIVQLTEHPSTKDKHGNALMVHMCSYLSASTSFVDRLTDLASGAIEEALLSMDQGVRRRQRDIPLVLGVPAWRVDDGIALARELERRLKSKLVSTGKLSSIRTVSGGRSAGLVALNRARQHVAEGPLDICLAGGVDSYMDALVLQRLDAADRIRTLLSPTGFRPGEGAGICVLASPEIAASTTGYGELLDVACPLEDEPTATTSSPTDEGLGAAWTDVLTSLPQSVKVSHAVCDMNGEQRKTAEFYSAYTSHWDRFEQGFTCLCPAEHFGDVGAATGPLDMVLASTLGVLEGGASTTALLWTSSEEDGQAAAIVTFGAQPERAT